MNCNCLVYIIPFLLTHDMSVTIGHLQELLSSNILLHLKAS